jgi:hypothetical protein
MNSTLNHTLQVQPTHLTPDQIDDHLIGDLAPAPAAHLASCAECTERLALAAQPLADFESVSRSWSERRSATLPIPEIAAARPFWQSRMAWAMASFACVLGIALTNASHQAMPTPEAAPSVASSAPTLPVQAAAHAAFPAIAAHASLTETASLDEPASPNADTRAQISADDQMLQAVDDEMDTPAENPATLGLEPVSDTISKHPAVLSLQD